MTDRAPTLGARLRGVLARVTQSYQPYRATRIVYQQRTLGGVRVSPDTALQSAAVWACVQILSKSVAQLPWRAMRRLTAQSSEIADNTTLDGLLNERANADMGAFTFRQTMVGHVLLWGNAFAEIERDNAGRPINLWPIEPDRVYIKRGPSPENPRRGVNELWYQITNQTQGVAELDSANMFHIHGLSYDGVTGYQTVGYAAQSIGLAMAIERFGASFFGNNGTPGGTIKGGGGKLSPEGKELLLANFNERHQGPDNAFKWHYLDNGMEAVPFPVEPEKGQFTQAAAAQVDQICRYFGVPPHKVAQLARCMPADTLVFTEGGPKTIDKVEVGERVWSVGENGLRLATVLNNWENGVDEILEISTTNRRFRCNRQHRVPVRRAIERPLKPGEIGGRNVGGRKVRIDWVSEYVPACDLRTGDVLIALDRLPDSGNAIAPNGRLVTEDFMAICGLLLGDGNVTKHKNRPVGIQIARADDARYMDHYRAALLREFAGMRLCSGSIAAGAVRPFSDVPMHLTEGARQTKMKSTAVGKEMDALGFSGTARTKRVPGWVFVLSETMRLAFLRGFFDADGTVNKMGRMSCDSASRALLEDVRHLCMSCGVPVTNVQVVTVDPRISGGYGRDVCVMYRFTCSDPGQNVRIGSHDPDDAARLQAGRAFERKGRKYPRGGGRTFENDGLSLSKIVDITLCKPEPVFDIEVADSHCFFANGVQVHNSTNNNIEHQGIEFVTDGIIPLTMLFEQEADYKLIGRRNPSRLYTRIDVRSLQRGDLAARTVFYQAMWNVGAMSPNMILEAEGMNPIGKDGDARFVPINFQTLEKAVAPTPDPVAAPAGGDDAASDDPEAETEDDTLPGGSDIGTGDGPSQGG